MKASFGHKIKLDPTKAQIKELRKACGVSRLAWNFAVAENQIDAKARKNDPTHEFRSPLALRKHFNSIKEVEYPFVYESPKDANQEPFRDFGKALKNYFKNPEYFGRPAFKKKGKSTESFRINNDQFAILKDRVRLPLLGFVNLLEEFKPKSDRDLKINNGTIILEAGEWYLSISYQCEITDPKIDVTKPVIAIDLGLRTFATTLDTEGEILEIQAPQPLKKCLKKLAKAQRAAARCEHSGTKARNKRHRSKSKSLSTKAKKRYKEIAEHNKLVRAQQTLVASGAAAPATPLVRKNYNSKSYEKRMNKVRKIHTKIRNVRNDFLHKLTTKLVRENQAVLIEDLSVTGMARNKKWARKVSDLGFRTFRTMLEYKGQNSGTKIHLVNRWFPSSKTCNCCGNVNSELKLQKHWMCPTCGFDHDRDVNAVHNMLNLYRDGSLWLSEPKT